jgi:hypothetical protein
MKVLPTHPRTTLTAMPLAAALVCILRRRWTEAMPFVVATAVVLIAILFIYWDSAVTLDAVLIPALGLHPDGPYRRCVAELRSGASRCSPISVFAFIEKAQASSRGSKTTMQRNAASANDTIAHTPARPSPSSSAASPRNAVITPAAARSSAVRLPGARPERVAGS